MRYDLVVSKEQPTLNIFFFFILDIFQQLWVKSYNNAEMDAWPDLWILLQVCTDIQIFYIREKYFSYTDKNVLCIIFVYK